MGSDTCVVGDQFGKPRNTLSHSLGEGDHRCGAGIVGAPRQSAVPRPGTLEVDSERAGQCQHPKRIGG